MRLKINIDTENDAFSENLESECARILKELATWIEHNKLSGGDTPKWTYDINGNRVGKMIVQD